MRFPKVEPWYVMLGKQFVGMMPFMLIIAAVLSGITEDWTDFAVITLMLIVNVSCLASSSCFVELFDFDVHSSSLADMDVQFPHFLNFQCWMCSSLTLSNCFQQLVLCFF